MKKFSTQKGFTLIELLVSMLILTTVGSLVFAILYISIRSTAKINNIQLIRQNGNNAITQMARMIQFSQQFSGVSIDGTNYISDCETPNTGSGSLRQYSHIQFTSFDDGVTVFSCTGDPLTIASNSASLIDTTAYVISDCNFTCTQISPSSPQTIGISFTISKRSVNNFLDDASPLPFSTSVTLRNFRY